MIAVPSALLVLLSIIWLSVCWFERVNRIPIWPTVVFLFVAFVSLWTEYSHPEEAARRLPNEIYRIFVGMVFILGSAIGLFILKSSPRATSARLYSIIEILVALCIGLTTMANIQAWAELPRFFGFFTSIYLLIRGFDNYGKALEKAQTSWPKEKTYLLGAPLRVLVRVGTSLKKLGIPD